VADTDGRLIRAYQGLHHPVLWSEMPKANTAANPATMSERCAIDLTAMPRAPCAHDACRQPFRGAPSASEVSLMGNVGFMHSDYVSRRMQESAQRFLMYIGPDADLQLLILKGHLLIEETLRAIIEERISGHAALGMDDGSKWTFDHKARLAEALCYGEEHDTLWTGVRKLNRVRNKLAHHVEPAGLSDMIDDLNHSWPLSTQPDQKQHLRQTLVSMFIALHDLVERRGQNSG
jgi:hypothetical protein